jgi:hypothetical protein
MEGQLFVIEAEPLRGLLFILFVAVILFLTWKSMWKGK